jgi:hypothetical protein
MGGDTSQGLLKMFRDFALKLRLQPGFASELEEWNE